MCHEVVTHWGLKIEFSMLNILEADLDTKIYKALM